MAAIPFSSAQLTVNALIILGNGLSRFAQKLRANQTRFYGGAKHPQTRSIAPSVKAVIMIFHCRFGKLSSALWFVLWRLVSISACVCMR